MRTTADQGWCRRVVCGRSVMVGGEWWLVTCRQIARWSWCGVGRLGSKDVGSHARCRPRGSPSHPGDTRTEPARLAAIRLVTDVGATCGPARNGCRSPSGNRSTPAKRASA